MTDSHGQSDFAKRLERIEARRGVTEQSPKKRSVDPLPSFSQKPVQKSYKVRNFFIWCFILGVVAVGGFMGWTAYAPNQTVSLASLSEATKVYFGSSTRSMNSISDGRLQIGTRTSTQPQIRELTDTGWQIRSPAVLAADYSEINLDDLVVNFELTNENTSPANILPLETNSECVLRRPTANEVVHNVRLGTAALETSVSTFSKAQLATALTNHIESLRSDRARHETNGPVPGGFEAIDVFVTDKSAPIYLVLQSNGSGIIWNVHLAEGVELAHVAMIGPRSGIVSPPAGTTIEALKIGDFVEDFGFGSNDEIRPCMISPWRFPEDHWPAHEKAASGNRLFENQLHSFTTGYRAYNAWYQGALGLDAGTNVVAASKAAHVLVGPKPSALIQYSSMDGKDIHLTQSDYTTVGQETLNALRRELLVNAAGGDLANLMPAYIESVSQ